eukprot:m.215170 g.215170  ORF g.215170 m.215170 type:complete len:70 (+) comp39826_c0_seq23:290-499(+)
MNNASVFMFVVIADETNIKKRTIYDPSNYFILNEGCHKAFSGKVELDRFYESSGSRLSGWTQNGVHGIT